MLRALFSSATGLAAQQFSLDVLSNNLANANTNGFKASHAVFQDLVYQINRLPGTQTGTNSQLPTGSQVGLGVSAGTTAQDFTQGTIANTGGAFDMAIQGPGFFKVLMSDGTFEYTRDGDFSIDSTGKIVTAEGNPVSPEIVIPPNNSSVSIGADGQVSVTLAGSSTPQVVGQLTLATFPNPQGLINKGGNLYQQSAASGQPTDGNPGASGMGTLLQGSVEQSNVSVVDEMVKMIILQRAYETNSKVIQTADQMLSTTNNIKQ